MTGYMVGWDGVYEAGKRPSGIHPLASIGGPPESRDWKIGDDFIPPQISDSALINAFCVVDSGIPPGPPTSIGDRTFIMSTCHIAHNCVIGNDVEFASHVTLNGYVTVGDRVHIGGGAWVKQRITIGEGAVIGGGAVVVKDVPPHEVWAGNPARFIRFAWTHPVEGRRELADTLEPRGADEPSVEASADFPDPDEMWEHMRPWHYRGMHA